jgi:hypothetical protein
MVGCAVRYCMEVATSQTLPAPPPSMPSGQDTPLAAYPCRGWRKARILLGVVTSFFMLLAIPGWFALGSYRRWRDGEQGKPALLLRVWSWYVVLVLAIAVPAGIVAAVLGAPTKNNVQPASLAFVAPPAIEGVPVLTSRAATSLLKSIKGELSPGSFSRVYGFARPQYIVVAQHLDGDAQTTLNAFVDSFIAGSNRRATFDKANEVSGSAPNGVLVVCGEAHGSIGDVPICGWGDSTRGDSGIVLAVSGSMETAEGFTEATVPAING